MRQPRLEEGSFEKMRIPRRYYPIPVVLLISGVVFAWGAATLIININNTATVIIQPKNLALDILATGSTCPAYGSSAYSQSNSTISLTWPSILEPGSSSFLFCLENVGTATSATFTQGTVTPSPSPGNLTISPLGILTIAATSVTPITTTLTASTGAPPTQYQFTLTIS